MSSVPPPLTHHYLRTSSASDAAQPAQQKLIIRFTLSTGERHALTAEHTTLLSALLDKLWQKCHIQYDQSHYVIRLLYGEIYFQTMHKISQIVKIAACFNEQYTTVSSTAPLVIDLLLHPASDIGHNISREQRTAHTASGVVQCSSTVYRVNKSGLLSKQHKKQYFVLVDITLFIYDNEAQYKANQPAADWISMSSVTAAVLTDTALQHKQYTHGLELNCDSIGKGLMTVLLESDAVRTQWLYAIQALNLRHTKSLSIAVCEELVARGTRNAGIKTEGIFRISGNKDTVQNLRQQYSLSLYPRLCDVSDDHALAGLLKLALRQMNEPLLTYALYAQWLNIAHISDVEQRVAKCVELCKLMPAAHYYFASYLIHFLARVAHYSSVNMMHSKNLSVVIAPNILKPEVETVQSLSQDNQYVLIVVQTLIDHCHRIWPRATGDKPAASRPQSLDSTQKVDLSSSAVTHTIVAEPTIDLTYLTLGSSTPADTATPAMPPSLSSTSNSVISLADTIQSLQSQLQQLNQQYEISQHYQQTLLQQIQPTQLPTTQQQLLITVLSNEIDKKQSAVDSLNMTNIQLQQLKPTTPVNTSPHKIVNSSSFTYLPPPQQSSSEAQLMPPPKRAQPPPLPVLPRCLSATTPVSSQHNTPAHSPQRDAQSTRTSNADVYDTQSVPAVPSRRSSATAPNQIAAELKALHAARLQNGNGDFNTATTHGSDSSSDVAVDRRSSNESNVSAVTADRSTPVNAANAENSNVNTADGVVPAIAKFNYQCGQRKQDITLTRGDPIDVDEQDEAKNGAGWLHGINRATGEIGYFPKTYVKLRQ